MLLRVTHVPQASLKGYGISADSRSPSAWATSAGGAAGGRLLCAFLGEVRLPAQGPRGQGRCGQDSARPSPRLSSLHLPALFPSLPIIDKIKGRTASEPAVPCSSGGREANGGKWEQGGGSRAQRLLLREGAAVSSIPGQRPGSSTAQAGWGTSLCPPASCQVEDPIFQISTHFFHPENTFHNTDHP